MHHSPCSLSAHLSRVVRRGGFTVPLVIAFTVCFEALSGAGNVAFEAGGAASADQVVVVVEAGPYDRRDTLLSMPAPAKLEPAKAWQMTAMEDGGRSVPVQSDGEGRLWWQLDTPLSQGESRRYRLHAADSTDERPRVAWQEDDGRLIAQVDGQPVCVYHVAEAPSPDPQAPYYARSGFLHPLYDPNGQIVTDDFPPDHPHQHGVFYAWVNTEYEGREVDFWNQQKLQGTVRHREVLERADGPVFAELAVRLAHVSFVHGDETTVLDETWRLRVYAVPGLHILDLQSRQQCVDGQLHLRQYHYGGFGIRGRRNWTLDQGADRSLCAGLPTPHNGPGFLTSEGKDRLEGNHTRPLWTAMFGPTEGEEMASILAIGSSDNFRAPQPVRLHPSMPYFCLFPGVEGPFEIGSDQPYESQFRILVHSGLPDAEQADRWTRDYLHPPEVRLIAED